jgi:hypothetical protein
MTIVSKNFLCICMSFLFFLKNNMFKQKIILFALWETLLHLLKHTGNSVNQNTLVSQVANVLLFKITKRELPYGSILHMEKWN